MNRYALALLLALISAGLLGCGSADNDPAQANVLGKPAQSAPQEK